MAPKKAYMRLDFFQTRDFVIIQGLFLLAIIIAIIVGATGPGTYYQVNFFAYNCANGDHLSGPCEGGVQLGKNSSQVKFSNYDVGKPLSQLNQFMGVDFMPFAFGDSTITKLAILKTSVEVGNGTSWSNLLLVENPVTSELSFTCPNALPIFNKSCTESNILQINRITWEYYRITITLEDYEPCNADDSCYDWLADAQISVYSVTDSYTTFVLGFRTTYVIIAILMFCVYLFYMQTAWVPGCFNTNEPETEASFEQKWMFLLLAALILYCDPFYGLRVISYGWILEVIGVLFEVISDSTLLLFWLIMLDKIQKENQPLDFKWFYLPKYIGVGLYAFFDMVSLSWLRARYAFNPVLANDQTFENVIFPLIIVTQVIFFILIVWVIYLVITSWVEISTRHSMMMRFAHLGLPTVILVLSEIVGMFAGVLSNSKPSALAFLYFFTLRNAYIYALLAGYWPIFGRETAIESQAVEVIEEEGERERLVTLKPGQNPFGPATD